MSDDLVLNIVKCTNEPILALDLHGKVIFWNKAAERIFGYSEVEVLGKFAPFIKNKNSFEFETIIQQTKEGKSLNFKTQKQDKEGRELQLILNTNPIYMNDSIVGVSAIIQETDLIKRVSYLNVSQEVIDKEPKRTFEELRDLILSTLYKDKKTINQVSIESGINWRTVEKHLTFLIGKKLVTEIFSSEYVRIFELTSIGKEYVEEIKEEHMNKYFKK